MAVRRDILDNIKPKESTLQNKSARDDIFNTSLGYSERGDYLSQFGISSEVGRRELINNDSLLAEMAKLEENRKRLDEQSYQSKVDFSGSVARSNGSVSDERGIGAAIVGSLGAGFTNVVKTTLASAEKIPAFQDILDSTDRYRSVIFDNNKTAQEKMQAVAQFEKESAKSVGNILKYYTPILGVGLSIKDLTKSVIKAATEGSQTENVLQPLEDKIRKYADVDQEKWWETTLGGAFESLPASVATRIPYLGWIILGTNASVNSLKETTARIQAGENITKEVAIIKAMGDAALEIGTEMLFPAFGRFGATAAGKTLASGTKGILDGVGKKILKTFGKELTENVSENFLKNFSKKILLQVTEEGAEEAINYFMGGILSKFTTDRDASLFTGKDALITFEGMRDAFIQGAIASGIISVPQASRSFYRTREYAKSMGQKLRTVEFNKVTGEYISALNHDMNDDATKNVVASTLAKGMLDDMDNNPAKSEVIKKQARKNLMEQEVSEPTVINDEFISNLKTTVAQNKKAEVQAVKEKKAKAEKAKEKRSGKPFVSKPATILETKQAEVPRIEDIVQPVEKISQTEVEKPPVKAETKQDIAQSIEVPKAFKKERIKTRNEDGTYNLKNLKESARRLKIAIGNADIHQRSKMKDSLFILEERIKNVEQDPNYNKKEIKASNKKKSRTKTTTKFTQKTSATASETVSTEKVDKVPVEKTEAVKKPVAKSKTIKSKKTAYAKGEWIKDKDGEIYQIESKESDGYNVRLYNPESKKFVMDTFVEFKEIASGTKKQAVSQTESKGKTKTTTTKAETVAKLPEVLQKIVSELPKGTMFNVNPITNKKDVKPMTLDEYSKLYESVLPEAKFRKGLTEGKVIYNDVVYELITPVTEAKGQSALAKAMNVQAEKKISEKESLGIVSKESKILSDIVDKIAGNRDNVKNVTSDILPENIDYKNMTNAELNQRFKNIIGDEAYDTLEKNRKRVNDSGIWQKIRENANIKRNLLSGSVPIDLKYGDLRKLFRLYKNSKQASNQYASEAVNAIYSIVPTEQIPLFMNMITMLDITDDIKLKRRGRSPINLTEQQIISALELINNAAKQNPVMFSNLLKAIDSRREIVREAVVEFVNESAKAELDYSYLLLRQNYMFHDVIEYDSKFFEGDMPAELKKIYKGKKKASGVAIKGRKGSVKDYLTDTFVLDWMSIARLKQMTVTVKILAEMQRYSIPESVTFDKNGTMFLPEGYIQVSAAALGIHNEQYSRNYIPERIQYRFDKIAEEKGLKKGTKKYRQALLRYNRTRFLRNFDPIADKSGLKKGSKEYWRAYTEYRLMKVTGTLIVPEQFGDAIKTFMEYTPKKSYEVLTRKAMNIWKWTKIRAPHAVFKYNMRNMFGDLDAVFAGNIKALSKIGKSWSDLYNFYRNGKVNEGFEQYMLSGGLLTGVSAVTLGDVYKLPAMSDYYKQNKRGLISETKMRSLIKKVLLETPTEFREQLLRYAAYLQWMEDIQKDGRVKNYGASHIVEIDSIREVHDKAFKLSNDLLGAYDDTSLLGQGIADHLIPFYRFTEINMKRYYRLLKNSFYTSDAVISEGMSMAKRLGLYGRIGALGIFRLGKIGVQLSLYYGTLALINFLFAGDEEDELPQSVKDNPHLVLPLGWVGDGKIHYIDRLGSFAELMDMFAIDYGMAQDIRDIVTGRQELVDVLKESAGAFPMHFINSAFPAAKFMIEYVSGKSFYPNPSSPSNIRDKGEYLANQLGLKPLYKAIKGMPIPQGTYWKEQISVLSNSVLPGDAAMWDVYDMKDRFIRQYNMPDRRQENRNKDSLEYKRSMALYYYKLALKLQDKRAAEKYFNDYMMYGGTKNGMKTSISWLDPRRGFNAGDLKKFKEWMTVEELETFNRAIDYYNEFIKNN